MKNKDIFLLLRLRNGIWKELTYKLQDNEITTSLYAQTHIAITQNLRTPFHHIEDLIMDEADLQIRRVKRGYLDD